MSDIVDKVSNGKLKLTEEALGLDASLVHLDSKRKKITFNKSINPLRKRKSNTVLKMIEMAYFLAEDSGKTGKEKHEIFYNILLENLDNII